MPLNFLRIERPVHLPGHVSGDADRRRGRSGRSNSSGRSNRFGLKRSDQTARVDPKGRLALAARGVAPDSLILSLDGKRIGPDQEIIDLKIRQLAAVEFALEFSNHSRFLEGRRAAGEPKRLGDPIDHRDLDMLRIDRTLDIQSDFASDGQSRIDSREHLSSSLPALQVPA